MRGYVGKSSYFCIAFEDGGARLETPTPRAEKVSDRSGRRSLLHLDCGGSSFLKKMNMQANKFFNDRVPLSVDWLGVSAFMTEPKAKPFMGLKWVKQTETNVWKSRGIYVNEFGDKVATLLFNPKSAMIDSRACLIEVANEWLYHGVGMLEIVNRFCEAHKAVVTGISRLDLCVDFECHEFEFEVIVGLAERKYYVQGKQNWFPWWSKSNDYRLPNLFRGKEIPHQISWGHKTSRVKWKVYYKWRELTEAAGRVGYEKPYIVDMWKMAGMDPVYCWRLEVSMKYCNGLVADGKVVSLEVFSRYTKELFLGMVQSRFVVRENQGHKDKTNDRIVQWLPLSNTRMVVRCRQYVSDNERSGVVSLLRKLVLSLEATEVLMCDEIREGVFLQIENICRHQHLFGYLQAIVGLDFDSWVEDVRCKAYEFEAEKY